jgi:4-amino-4-deoxychorismate lyase
LSPQVAVLVNGVPGAALSALDRGLQFGDGLFETMRCEQGAIRWFDRHLGRLRAGCERLGLPEPDGALLRAEAESLVAGRPRALAKIIVTRGVATARGYAPAGNEIATRVVMAQAWSAAAAPEFRVGHSPVQLGCNPQLAGIKHLNRLEQVLAQQGAVRAGWQEALMRSSAGDVVCGSMSNLFAVQGTQLRTPALTQCGVAGVMRSLVLEFAPRLGFSVEVAPVSPQWLSEATAMFVTNVRLGVQAVHWYEGRRLEPDPRCAQLQELIDGTLA